ncbi:SPX domain-containing membrane protein At4g11810-like isoform X4 [Durio zibethinus]|uniref:SPX domain-containing membrane protein At4g11810-like isoform X4 n=1 Tax=Durio zibethinus TaxID=66656 RepID=A0A6P5WVK1_DURZI|nr:SPX domain-containing membrane protein At4g11810-like isoform X4 [Durio zibethinus]
MVAFGKKLKERQIQEWQGYYINYKLMKKKVNQYARQIEVGTQDHRHVLKDFSRMLDNQIEKIVLFLLEQQGLLGSRLTKLREQHDALEEPSEIAQIIELREAYRAVGQDLLMLLYFVEINAIGLRKILKKFDKRFHYRFTDYYVKTRANHPYSQLQQVFKHVGLGAVVGAISRNLHELQDRQGSYLSIYDPPALPLQDPMVDSIKAAVDRFGSARAVNRRYISDCVPLKIRMQASAGFVSASALGMACGPALAGILQTNFKIYKFTFNEDTLPGWVMSVAWLVYLIWLWISFKEPSRDIEENNSPHASTSKTAENDALEDGLKQALLITSEEKQEDDEDPEGDGSEETSKESRQPATSIASAYRLLTPSVKVQLLIYFMLKYAMEILVSESSVITSYYFNWSTSKVAIFLACLGLTVLPVNIVVGSYISNMFEDRQILLASEIMVCIGILLSFHIIIPYNVPQYVCSGLIMFVFAEVLEGVNLSLLSRVMSSRLSRGTYNGGLLSTEAGTIARVIADATITLAGYLGQSLLLNITLLPSLLICISSIIATCFTYNSLY